MLRNFIHKKRFDSISVLCCDTLLVTVQSHREAEAELSTVKISRNKSPFDKSNNVCPRANKALAPISRSAKKKCLLSTSHCDGSTNTGELQARNYWKAAVWTWWVINLRESSLWGKTEGAFILTWQHSSMFIGFDPHWLDLYTQTREIKLNNLSHLRGKYTLPLP